MSFDHSNITFEQKIDAYIKGHLKEDEVQELWVNLLKEPKNIDYLQTELDLTRYHRQKNHSKPKQYWKWFAAVAAVAVVAVGLNLFFSEPVSDGTIEQIVLRDNLATARVMRSGSSTSETVDSLLNTGFENAINDNIDEALVTYQKVVTTYPYTAHAAKASMNLGIINYNRGKYRKAIHNLKNTLSSIKQNRYMLEQVYWYLGNALINTQAYDRAANTLHKTYQLNGVHAEAALKLLKKLNQERGNK